MQERITHPCKQKRRKRIKWTEQGKGSEFTIRFELTLCDASDEDKDDGKVEETDFAGKRLLLADDIEINREIAVLNLEMPE